MDVLTALGLQFRIQRFISIPNYKLPGESLVHLVARIIPFAILSGIALADVVDMLRFTGPHIDKMSNVPFIVSKFDMIVIKLGVVFVAIISCCINRKHLKALKTIDAYDESIRRYQKLYIKQPIPFPKPKRSNMEFFLIFLVNAILVLNLHLMTSLDAPPKQALFHAFYALLICIHDYVCIYISNIIRLFGCHETQLMQILQDDLSRHNQEVFSLVTGFTSTLGVINQAFGSLTFFTFIHHLIGSCMSTYLLFWLIFVSPDFEVRILFILSSTAYNMRMVSFLIHMSIVGEAIPKKIEKLQCMIRRWMKDEELCSTKENWVAGLKTEDDEENFTRAVKFNTHQLLLKYLHQGTQISASEYFTINNSAIYATFGAVITYLMVLIQFQELEEAKAQEGQDLL
uniref:Gustatory receptor n=1 Tax=Lutzomyia longipalpis TaxID=7200 RepID=A0A3F2ZDA3_LUTLO